MKKVIICQLVTILLLCNFQINAGTSQATSTKTTRSNTPRNAHHAVGGSGFTVEIRNGEIWSWGLNDNGQLGDNSFNNSLVPVQEFSQSNMWVAHSTGFAHTVALKADGTLWAWGDNSEGQLGSGNTNDSHIPQQIGTDNDWVSLGAGGNHTFGIKSNGTLWATGLNQLGQLGINSSTPFVLQMTQVGAANNWKSVTGGFNNSAAIQSNGTIWTWGSNSSGQLGISTPANQLAPQQVGSATNWISVECGQDHVLGLKSDGTLWGWGSNNSGQLGNNSTTNSTVPVQIGTNTNWIGMACGQTVISGSVKGHSLGVQANGTLWAWGNNEFGQLGDGTTNEQHSPMQIAGFNNCVNVETGFACSFARKSDGSLYAWGHNAFGSLGNNSTSDVSAPEQVSVIPVGWSNFSAGNQYTMAVKSDGTLWAWGDNSSGQFGNGLVSTTPVTTAMQIGVFNNWVVVACGLTHTLALKSDGTLWSWGSNSHGELGIGTTTSTPFSLPQQVGTSNNWVSVSCGDNYSMAIRSDGTLYGWGMNNFGQLGIGSNVEPNVPVLVTAGGANWMDVECGSTSTLAVKSRGTLYSWGNNSFGQLGLGSTTTQITTPQQVGTLTNWMSVANGQGGKHAVAVKTNGTLWAWGLNNFGQLGDGTTITRHSPVQIGTQSTWTLVSGGANFSMGLRVNGTIFGWGFNGDGALGDGTNLDHHSPSPIASTFIQSNAIMVVCGHSNTGIIRSERSLICMTGSNANGQLGNGNTTTLPAFECEIHVLCDPIVATVTSRSDVTCNGGNDGFALVTSTGGSGFTYNWTPSGGNAPLANGLTAGTYVCTITNSCGSTASITEVITQPIPALLTVSTTLPALCAGNSTNINVSSADASLTYLWQPGSITGANINVAPALTTTYTVIGTSTGGCTNTVTITITVTTPPATPQPITGPAIVCGSTTATYSIPAIAGVTSYTWTVPSGMTILGSSSGTAINVNISPSFNIGNITVSATNSCGTSSLRNLTVHGNSAPAIPSAITGPTVVCTPSTVTYSTPFVAGVSSHTWTVSPGLSIVTGQGTLALTVNVSPTFISGNVMVSASSTCGTSALQTLAVTGISSPASPVITGPSVVCNMSTATYNAASAGATSYAWTVPSGMTIISGQGTSTITVSIAAGTLNGSITCSASNSCGTSTVTSYLVTKKPQVPGAISGPTSLCSINSATYSVAPVFGATSYQWTLPSGITASGAATGTTINVNIASSFISGNISVSAVNACGNIPGTSITVYGKVPVTPAPITGPSTVCNMSTATYHTAGSTGATAYNWTVPGGVTVLSGQGSTTIVVSFPAGFISGTITVVAFNSCGNSYARNLALTGCSLSSLLSPISVSKSMNETDAMNFTIYPNPVTTDFNVDIVSGTDKDVTVEVYDVLGNKLIHQKEAVTNGITTVSVNIETFTKGMYFIRITDNNSTNLFTQRIIKQ